MAEKQMYRQCTLQRGNTYQVSWIPLKYANINQVLKLRSEEIAQEEPYRINSMKYSWEDGWRVISVGAIMHEDYIHDPHNAIKKHRKATGDSMAKKDFAKP